MENLTALTEKRHTMKQVTVIQNVGEVEEIEIIFIDEVMPMAICRAERWSKARGLVLVKSPKKIAQILPGCHRVAGSKNEKVFYAFSKHEYAHFIP